MLLSPLVLRSVLPNQHTASGVYSSAGGIRAKYDGAIKGGSLNRYLIGILAFGLVAAGCASTAVDVSPTTTGAQPPLSTTATAAPTTTEAHTTASTTAAATTTDAPEVTMEISSPAFEHQAPIPEKHSCDGDDVSPRLDIANLPEDTVSLVLIMDDPDAPIGTWDHWIAYDIAPTESIAEGDHEIGTSGTNSWATTGYGGPCPPSGTHRYVFQIYALDIELGMAEGATKAEVIVAMDGHIIEEAQLVGLFSRE